MPKSPTAWTPDSIRRNEAVLICAIEASSLVWQRLSDRRSVEPVMDRSQQRRLRVEYHMNGNAVKQLGGYRGI